MLPDKTQSHHNHQHRDFVRSGASRSLPELLTDDVDVPLNGGGNRLSLRGRNRTEQTPDTDTFTITPYLPFSREQQVETYKYIYPPDSQSSVGWPEHSERLQQRERQLRQDMDESDVMVLKDYQYLLCLGDDKLYMDKCRSRCKERRQLCWRDIQARWSAEDLQRELDGQPRRWQNLERLMEQQRQLRRQLPLQRPTTPEMELHRRRLRFLQIEPDRDLNGMPISQAFTSANNRRPASRISNNEDRTSCQSSVEENGEENQWVAPVQFRQTPWVSRRRASK